MPYKVLVVWPNGDTEFAQRRLADGKSEDATFVKRADAVEAAELFRIGFDDDEVQSVNVVRA